MPPSDRDLQDVLGDIEDARAMLSNAEDALLDALAGPAADALNVGSGRKALVQALASMVRGYDHGFDEVDVNEARRVLASESDAQPSTPTKAPPLIAVPQ